MKDKFGVITVDTGYLNRERYAACYIINSGNEAAVIETNTNFSVPKIFDALKVNGISPENVRYVILTHVHLDHAGGAGKLMKSLPNAKLLVHPRGSRHMVDPEKLIKSVKSVYGEEEFNKMYGELVPVENEKVLESYDGMIVNLGEKNLEISDSPGHAKHHIVIFDRSAGILFSGDSFGIGYPRFRYPKGDLIFPSTSPVQFDPESAIKTYDKIESYFPERIYLTHFGGIQNVKKTKEALISSIDFFVKEGKKLLNSGKKGSDLSDALLNEIWTFFDKRIFSLRGKYLTSEEKQFLLLDADLNSKGVSFFLERTLK